MISIKNFNFKLTINLIKSTYISNVKRFYPHINTKISSATSQRILNIFNKQHLYIRNYPQGRLSKIIDNLYDINENNREKVFKNFRKILTEGKFNISKKIIENFECHSIINEIAHLTFIINRLMRPEESKIITENLSVQQRNRQEGISQPPKIQSIEEKKADFDKKHDIMIKKMAVLKENYEKKRDIDWKTIEEWGNYIQKRNIIKSNYTTQEHDVNIFLRTFFKENTKPKEFILAQLQDKLQKLKSQSNIFNVELFDKIQEKCFLENDYKNKIELIKKAMELLLSNKTLNKDALILLGIWSKAISLDEEQNPKLTREVYISANNDPQNFGIKSTTEKPDSKEIIQALKNKNYFIKDSSNNIPENQIISTAPLLHKTLIIPTKNGFYYVAMLTSSKIDTKSLAKTQEFNLDLESINKEQRFVVYSHFFACTNEELTLDLSALGFTQSCNLEGENVLQKIIQFFEEKQNEWENNYVQELMNINIEIFKNITMIFFSKNLKTIENDYKFFIKSMESLSIEQKERYLSMLLKEKEKEIENQNEQKYFSKLSENFQKLFNILNFFEKQDKIQIKNTVAKEEKNKMEKIFEEQKIKAQREKTAREHTGQLTAREKREAYQKQKNESSKNSSILQIENKKDE